MDKFRRLLQSSQAPDFRVGDLLHVQSWQYHLSFMMNNSKAVEFTAHLPRFGGLPPCRVARAQNPQISSLSQRLFEYLDPFGGT